MWSWAFSNRSLPDGSPNWQTSGLEALVGPNANRYIETLNDGAFLNCTDCPNREPIVFGSFLGLTQYFGMALAEVVSARDYAGGLWGYARPGGPTQAAPWMMRGGEAIDVTGITGLFAFLNRAGNITGPQFGFSRPIIAGS